MSTGYGDEEGMGPMERGRNRYQKKHYSGALQAFTEVSTTHLPSLVLCKSLSVAFQILSTL
jgi:F-box/TPR repeat protein Pof3